MFNFNRFIMDGLMDAVGKMPDYWVIMNASGWYEKGVLQQEDMAQLQAAIEAKNAPEEAEPTPEAVQ